MAPLTSANKADLQARAARLPELLSNLSIARIRQMSPQEARTAMETDWTELAVTLEMLEELRDSSKEQLWKSVHPARHGRPRRFGPPR